MPSARWKILIRAGTTALVAAVLLLASSMVSSAQNASLEYAIKATYLYKFAPFVTWPDAAFATAESPINLCIVGSDPFGPLIDQAVAGQQIGNRAIVVRRLRTVDRNTGCHIMYVGSTDPVAVAETINAVRGSPVLTVTDSASNAAAKGIINFALADNRVRFEINPNAASDNKLGISSKLLSLAVNARP